MPGSFEEFDNVAWEHGQKMLLAFKDQLVGNRQLYHDIAHTVAKHRPGGRAVEICPPQRGAFNVHYRVKFSDKGAGALMRIPIPAYFQNTEERLLGEVAALRFIADNTAVPVPLVLHHGTREECPSQLGPFLVEEWVDNGGDVVDVLSDPARNAKTNATGLSIELNPDIETATLAQMYGQMADVLLELAQPSFARIGALASTSGGIIDVACRPLSLNMSQLANFARVPHFELPAVETTYATASAYYVALADMHLQQLSYQRNNAVLSAADCRKKYIARQLFRKAAAEGRLADPAYDAGPFKLWCDDLRPANVLVDQTRQKVAAVVDWEFTHTAPAEFAYSPPWWLLLKAPDDWPAGLDAWVDAYEPRLELFLRIMEGRETERAKSRVEDTDVHIVSKSMRANWLSGCFWRVYATRRTWAFDAIYWRFLNEDLYGTRQISNEDEFLAQRLAMLPPAQVTAMDAFVDRKLAERDEGGLVDWYADGAEMRLPPDILSVGMESKCQFEM